MKVGITLIAILFTGSILFAQSEKNIIKQSSEKKVSPKISSKKLTTLSVKDGGSYNKMNQVSSPSKFVRENNKTLLQQIYTIGDERHRIETNKELSASERADQINNNKNAYNAKRSEFKNFIKAQGVLNVSLKEQRFYLSILKDDKKEVEYKRVVTLIKKSK
jgi:hypothetical protein